MISTIDITKTYTSDARTLAALDHISVKIGRGDFVVIMGRSGAGKSTLLGVMGGLLRPSSGKVLFRGQALWSLDERTRARVRAEEIGFVFQNASVIRSLTVIENVTLPRMFSNKLGSATELKRAADLLDVMELGHLTYTYTEKLSGGEKRRVAIASALMNNPSIVLADEPTGDLDIETESQIMDHFVYLHRKGTTIIIVTHNPGLASYANRVFQMECGNICEVASHIESLGANASSSVHFTQNCIKTPKSNIQ
ncbi:MAG: ABC transporter ATP-binding protein [Planctomycetota bacterium]|jgi:ABC-type lipoprotein export system ATPase subunit